MKKQLFLAASLFPLLMLSQGRDTLRTQQIEEVVFQRQSSRSNDQTNVSIKAGEAAGIASISGGIEGLIKTLPSVNSNTELSSQYMVRGGNYDENLIYINDIEIYRPFLIRNSMQEGMSIINPDMVSIVNFSAGGFEAKYGDKMSSALNIYYREPEKFEVSGEASLIGGRLTTGFATDNKKLTALLSGRYRNTNLILKTMNENTDFNPVYMDFQSFINYHVSQKFSMSFMGYYSQNDFEMIPRDKEVEFGTVNQPIRIRMFYSGKEDDRYKNMMGTFSLNYKPNDKWRFSLDNFAYQNREREYYSIASGYILEAFDPITNEPATSYDIGGQIEHARNDLLIKTYGAQFRTRFKPNINSDIELGLKYEREDLRDFTNEWKLIDSVGYSVPRDQMIPGVLDDSALELQYHLAGNNHIQPTRLSAYLQYSNKFYWGRSRAFVNVGARVANWSYNKETIFSPRAQFSIKPDWEQDMLFRISGGVYYQQPFYKEIKDLDGSFNDQIKSQRSYQLILGNDYEFWMYDRPFKLTTELYYKKMDQMIPYFMDNVRIRYAGQNMADGYAYGVDARLFGEFVPGVDSWLSASYARTFENINGMGDLPRGTDQRFRFAVFYQDYMPRFPKMRVNLTGVFAMGLPTGAPVMFDAAGQPDVMSRYQFQKTLPSYKRVDIGLSYVFIDPKEKNKMWGFWGNFEELTLGVQVFNAFNIYNTVANQWVTDVSNNYIYPVPVNLTGRFFNAKLEFRIK